jgi:apoptosis-inducing factor 2
MASHEIVILGGSFAGFGVAHEIMQKHIPKLTKSTGKTFHITIISLSSHMHFSVSAPRSVVDTTLIPIKDLEVPIKENLPRTDQLNFIHGKVTGLDYANRTVRYILLSDDYQETGNTTISYDSLFIALGSHSKHPAFKLRGRHSDTVAELEKLNQQITAAKSIVIAGGGPVAIETMGEIASKYGRSKALTIFTNGPSLLHNVNPDIGSTAASYLKNMGVHVGVNSNVTSTSALEDGKTRVNFGKGESVDVDLYIDATGVIPNSEVLPKELLNEAGFLIVDDYQRATDAGPLVYGVGDITGGWTMIVKIFFSKALIVENWAYEVSGGKVGKEKKYETPKYNMIIVPVGKNKSVGTAFGWRFPSFVGWWLKVRTVRLPRTIRSTSMVY